MYLIQFLRVMEVCYWIKNKRLKKDFVSSSMDDHCHQEIEEENCPGETNNPFFFSFLFSSIRILMFEIDGQ